MGGVPWKQRVDEEGDGERMETGVKVMDKEYRERVVEEDHTPVPRRLYIQKADLEKVGYTAGCPGCISMLRGTARQAHSEGCRRRVEVELSGTSRAAGAERRRREFLDRAAAREEELERRRRKRRSSGGAGGDDGGGRGSGDDGRGG